MATDRYEIEADESAVGKLVDDIDKLSTSSLDAAINLEDAVKAINGLNLSETMEGITDVASDFLNAVKLIRQLTSAFKFINRDAIAAEKKSEIESAKHERDIAKNQKAYLSKVSRVDMFKANKLIESARFGTDGRVYASGTDADLENAKNAFIEKYGGEGGDILEQMMRGVANKERDKELARAAQERKRESTIREAKTNRAEGYRAGKLMSSARYDASGNVVFNGTPEDVNKAKRYYINKYGYSGGSIFNDRAKDVAEKNRIKEEARAERELAKARREAIRVAKEEYKISHRSWKRKKEILEQQKNRGKRVEKFIEGAGGAEWIPSKFKKLFSASKYTRYGAAVGLAFDFIGMMNRISRFYVGSQENHRLGAARSGESHGVLRAMQIRGDMMGDGKAHVATLNSIRQQFANMEFGEGGSLMEELAAKYGVAFSPNMTPNQWLMEVAKSYHRMPNTTERDKRRRANMLAGFDDTTASMIQRWTPQQWTDYTKKAVDLAQVDKTNDIDKLVELERVSDVAWEESKKNASRNTAKDVLGVSYKLKRFGHHALNVLSEADVNPLFDPAGFEKYAHELFMRKQHDDEIARGLSTPYTSPTGGNTYNQKTVSPNIHIQNVEVYSDKADFSGVTEDTARDVFTTAFNKRVLSNFDVGSRVA